jgi:putative flippase GtrA
MAGGGLLGPERRTLLLQLARFAITGGGITAGAAFGYWLLATPFGVDPALSLTIVTIIFTAIGYIAHSKVSFRDHGSRDRQHIRTLRYALVALAGFALNQGFVWLLVDHFGGPPWWPIIPFLLVTPFVTFALQRRWVFG